MSIQSDAGFTMICDEKDNIIQKEKSWIDEYIYLDTDGHTVKLREKRIVVWSKQYADKTKHEREKAIDKALSRSSVAQIKSSTLLRNLTSLFDVVGDDEEVLTGHDIELKLNDDKLTEKEKYDGYYLIVTRLSAASIIDFIKSLKATTVDGEQYFLDGNSQPELLAAIESKYGVEINCRQQSIRHHESSIHVSRPSDPGQFHFPE